MGKMVAIIFLTFLLYFRNQKQIFMTEVTSEENNKKLSTNLGLSNRPESDEKPRRIIRINSDDERFKQYFGNFFQTNSPSVQSIIDLTVSRNPQGTYLYEVIHVTERRFHHIFWLSRSGAFYYDDEPDRNPNKPIPSEIWSELKTKPDVLDKVNTILMECYDDALNFYPWTHRPGGFVIEGGNAFGLEQGDFMGIRINYQEIKELLTAVETEDIQAIELNKRHLSASIVHELTHQEKDAGIMGGSVRVEIPSHITQFIYNPVDNEIFNRQIENTFKEIEKSGAGQKEAKPLGIYDRAIYLALLVVANRLAEHNEEYREVLADDKDPHKLNALRKLRAMMREEDKEFLRTTVLKEIINTDGNKLYEMAESIERSLGIEKK